MSRVAKKGFPAAVIYIWQYDSGPDPSFPRAQTEEQQLAPLSGLQSSLQVHRHSRQAKIFKHANMTFASWVHRRVAVAQEAALSNSARVESAI